MRNSRIPTSHLEGAVATSTAGFEPLEGPTNVYKPGLGREYRTRLCVSRSLQFETSPAGRPGSPRLPWVVIQLLGAADPRRPETRSDILNACAAESAASAGRSGALESVEGYKCGSAAGRAVKAMRSLLLLSGGPDSATLAAWAKANGHDDLHALYLRSGHTTDARELECADQIAAAGGFPLEIMDITPVVAALGGQRILIHSQSSIMPFGNAIVLSMAVTYALKIQAENILIALHADDAAESAEYRRDFIDKIESLAAAVHGRPRILTPFIGLSKTEVLSTGQKLGVDYAMTWSCVRPGATHCGYCGACRARAKAFVANGIRDPTVYQEPVVAMKSAAVTH